MKSNLGGFSCRHQKNLLWESFGLCVEILSLKFYFSIFADLKHPCSRVILLMMSKLLLHIMHAVYRRGSGGGGGGGGGDVVHFPKPLPYL